MRTVPELIACKRDGGALSAEEIQWLIRRYTDGTLPDYQMSALAMAVFFQGMSEEEMVALTLAMRDSGAVLDLGHVPGRKVDKHSTGGVGDKVSIALAPWVAACGVRVPMVSGRGLGHTGGTLDKLEAIPGFSVNTTTERFIELVATVGTGMIGQTKDVAPADKRLYALRDVTATVESVPLIVASILSKKLAEGIDALVLDVKVGRGAFMKDLDRARTLASALVRTAKGAGKDCVALLTHMDYPLGFTVGNALETAEAFAILHRRAPADLTECTVELAIEMLVLGHVARTRDEARAKLERALDDGSALATARRMVQEQGGDPRVVDDPSLLPATKTRTPIRARSAGFVHGIDALEVGLAGVALGAGRTRSEDSVDPAVGFVLAKTVGDAVALDEVVAWVHSDDEARALEAARRVGAAFSIASDKPATRPLVIERVE
ncbi:MAG: thymidine phosphorylase [Myxococcales bacterium]|nr:thymidine phosphorylase [Myxococcales bacterium]